MIIFESLINNVRNCHYYSCYVCQKIHDANNNNFIGLFIYSRGPPIQLHHAQCYICYDCFEETASKKTKDLQQKPYERECSKCKKNINSRFGLISRIVNKLFPHTYFLSFNFYSYSGNRFLFHLCEKCFIEEFGQYKIEE